MSRILLDGVTKTYGSVVALDHLSLEIEQGEFVALLGPSGCGKTTALRLVAGFLEPTSGTIRIGDSDVSSLPPHRRNIGMVFQDYALFPHMTVADNIAFGLVEQGIPRPKRRARVAELLALIQLPGMEERLPAQLSGGQQQRVALARALAIGPSVLLMDEPFGALDLKLRESMQVELAALQKQLGITTLFVTHDQGEAMNMCDRIVVLNQGHVEQFNTPEVIYRNPASEFVADFVGKISLFSGTVAGIGADSVHVNVGPHSLRSTSQGGSLRAGAAVRVGVRPESLMLSPQPSGHSPGEQQPENICIGRVVTCRFSGDRHVVLVDVEGIGTLVATVPAGRWLPAASDAVQVSWFAADTIVICRERSNEDR